jgi:hypothetical protein
MHWNIYTTEAQNLLLQFAAHFGPIHTYHAVLLPQTCRGLERSLSELHIRGMAGERDGIVNQTQPHRVNQMWKTQSKPLAERNGRRTAWERHGMCESAFWAPGSLHSKVSLLKLLWKLTEDGTHGVSKHLGGDFVHIFQFMQGWLNKVISTLRTVHARLKSLFCSHIHTKHIHALCGQNVELLNVKLVVHRKTTELLQSWYCWQITVC